MTATFFINKMTGNWIVQSTNYSLLKYHKSTETFLNQVTWQNIYSDNNNINNLLPSLNKSYMSHKVNLYDIEYTANHVIQRVYYTLIYHKESNEAYILKFNSRFNLTNKFVVTNIYQDYLSMTSKMRNITIIEKIYFLHSNLKVIKSVIKKNNICIGTSFSSEIRIS